MTMMTHSAVPAPIRPRINIELGYFAQIAKNLVQIHRHSREAQQLRRAHDAILKDVGLTRVSANGNTYLFSHRD